MANSPNHHTFSHVEEQPEIEFLSTNRVLNSPDPPGFLQQIFQSVKDNVFPQSSSSSDKKHNISACARVVGVLSSIFPVLNWARNYKASKFKNDLIAGLTLASLSIPQSIGYAALANLDPQYGLYGSVVPPLIYSVMGTSQELAIGPVAVVSLLISSMVSKLVDPTSHPASYIKLVFTVTFFAGSFQALFGFLRLGFLIDFLSHAAIVGFMAGAAIVIGLQQLKSLLAISHFTTKTDVVSVLEAVVNSFHTTWYPLNFVLGCSFLIFILITRFIGKKKKNLFWLPAISPVISVILSTMIVYLTKADEVHGIKIIKHFKGGLNPSSLNQLEFNTPHLAQVAKTAFICAIIALTEAVAVGRSFASIKGYNLDGNKEMIAMGFMNIAGSMSSCYVTTGSFSRTAVNFSAGCESTVSNVVMAISVLISLQVLTKLLYYTPLAILASIILSALPGLIDYNEAYRIWKVDKLDFLACAGAFIGVLFASVEIGLLVAVGVSFGRLILNSIRSDTEELGRFPGTDNNIFCDKAQYPGTLDVSGVHIIRLNSGSFCFANANPIKERITRYVTQNNNNNNKASNIILDMSNVMSIDSSGILALEEIHKKLVSRNVHLAIANPRWRVIHKLKIGGFVDKLGSDFVFLTVSEAVDHLQSLTTSNSIGLANC